MSFGPPRETPPMTLSLTANQAGSVLVAKKSNSITAGRVEVAWRVASAVGIIPLSNKTRSNGRNRGGMGWSRLRRLGNVTLRGSDLGGYVDPPASRLSAVSIGGSNRSPDHTERRRATAYSDGILSGERTTARLNVAPCRQDSSGCASQIVMTGDLLAGFAGGAEAGNLDLAAIGGVRTARMEGTARGRING